MPPQDPAQPGALKFEIDVGEGRGALLLRPTTFAGWLAIERLELEIPQVSFPLDITGGMAQFQKHRCRVNAATIAVDDGALDAFVRQHVALLAASGFEGLELRLLEHHVEASGRVRVGDRSVDFTARAFVVPDRGALRIVVGPVRLFGFLPRPAPIVGHDLASLLAGAVPLDSPDAARTVSAASLGLGDLLIRPLELFLARVFPSMGWRVPDAASAKLTGGAVGLGRVELRYEYRAPLVASPVAPPEFAQALDATRAADDLLLSGDVAAAAATYRFELSRARAHAPFLTERLLSVLVAREDTLRDAQKVAEEALARWPSSAAARLALAQVADGQGVARAAAEHLATAIPSLEEAGDDEDAVRAALAAARLLRDRDRARARDLYERVLKRRPHNEEAVDALGEHFQAHGDWQPLVHLWKRRVEATADPAEQSRLLTQSAKILLDRLDEPRRAREDLERAIALDGRNVAARDALATVLSKLGEHRAAIDALEELARLRATRRDAVGEGNTWARIAAVWEQLGDDEQAERAWRQALERLPGDHDVLARLIALAERRDRLDEAIAFAERLTEVCAMDDPRRKAAQRELLRLVLRSGDAERARHVLERVEASAGPFGLVARAALEERDGRLEEAAAALGEAATRVDGTPAANLHARLAGLLARLGRDDEALQAWADAFVAAPDSELGLRAARELAERARERGDAEVEAQWLDALLAAGPTAVEPALRRAELHLEAGEAEAARALLDALAGHGVDAASIRPLLADALAALGDELGRAEVLEQIARDPSLAPDQRVARLLEAAEARASAGDTETALTLAREAAGLAPGSPDVRRALAEAAWRAAAWDDVVAIYENLPTPDDVGERIEIARRLGVGMEHQGRLDEALTTYRAVVALPEATGEPLGACWRRVADVCERLGRFRDAVSACDGAARDERTEEPPARRAELHVRAARILHRRLSRPGEAMTRLDDALAIDPAHLPALDALETIHAERGERGAVADVLERKLDLVDDEDRRRELRARLAALTGADSTLEPPAAETAPPTPPTPPTPSAPSAPPSATPHAPLTLSDEIRAMEALLASLPLDDVRRHRELHRELGFRCFAAGDLPAARRHLERLLSEVPHQLDAQRSLAEILVRQEQWPEAARAHERTAALLSDDAQRAEALFRAGEIQLVHLGDREAAVDSFLKAIDLDPDHTGTLERLIDHYFAAGDAAAVLDLASDLERRKPFPTLDRERVAAIAVAAAISEDAAVAARAVRALGEAAAAALSGALAAARLDDGSPPARLLADLGRRASVTR